MIKITETQIVKACLDYLHLKGIFAKRINTTGIYNYKTGKYIFNPNTPRGMSDILVVIEGKAIFVECKRKGGKQNENQRAFDAEVRQAGAKYFIIRSVEDLIKVIPC